MTAGQTKTITFLTRDRCTLCDLAFGRIRLPSRLLGVAVTAVDVDGDPALSNRYGDRVPVVLAADGALLAEGPISTWDAWRAAWRARRI